MRKLRIKFLRSYISKNGNRTFVYGVSGSTADIKAYEMSKGSDLRTDDKTGQPLFFTTRHYGQSAELIQTKVSDENPAGNWIVNTEEFDRINSIVQQCGDTVLGRAVAAQAAAQLLGTKVVTTAQVAEVAPKVEAVVETEIPADEDLDNL